MYFYVWWQNRVTCILRFHPEAQFGFTCCSAFKIKDFRKWVMCRIDIFFHLFSFSVEIAVCLGVCLTSKGWGDQRLHLLFPVVAAVWGSAPARMAAVWLSVWGNSKPFTAAQTAACLQPLSFNSLSVSLHYHCFFFLFSFTLLLSTSPVQLLPDCFLPHFTLCTLNLSVCVSVSPSSSSSSLAPFYFGFFKTFSFCPFN